MYASACICYDFFLRDRFGLKVTECTYLPTAEDMIPFWYEENKFTPIDERYANMIREIVDNYYNSQLMELSPIKTSNKQVSTERCYSIGGILSTSSNGGIKIVDGKKIIQ